MQHASIAVLAKCVARSGSALTVETLPTKSFKIPNSRTGNKMYQTAIQVFLVLASIYTILRVLHLMKRRDEAGARAYRGRPTETPPAPALESSPVGHLVVIHRLLHGTIAKDAAADYLYLHLRDDADFADMGRPLKDQYEDLSCQNSPKKP